MLSLRVSPLTSYIFRRNLHVLSLEVQCFFSHQFKEISFFLCVINIILHKIDDLQPVFESCARLNPFPN